MKFFILTLFFCAFVAAAFSAPVAQDEASDIAAKIADAIPKLRKAVAGLRADGQGEAARMVADFIPRLKMWTIKENVEAKIVEARIMLNSVQRLLNDSRKYWEKSSSLSVASTESLNKAISNLFADSEAQDLVAKFKDAIPKLVKIEAGLRRDGQIVYADRVKTMIRIFKKTYTDLDMVKDNLKNSREVWEATENILKKFRKYWDNSSLTVSAISKSLFRSELSSLSKAINALDNNLFADSEAQDLVAKFKDAIPKLVKIEAGLRRDGQIVYADRVKTMIRIFKKTYTDLDMVKDNLKNSREVWEATENILKKFRKYWDNSSLTDSVVSKSLIESELSSLSKAINALDNNEDQEADHKEAQDLVAKFKDAIPKLEKIKAGILRDGDECGADGMEMVIESVKKSYIDLDNVESGLKYARSMWKVVERVLKEYRRYWDNSSLTVSVVSNNLIGSELSSLSKAINALDNNEDQEVAEIVAQFKEALPKLVKIAQGLRKDGKVDAADKMEKLAEGLKVYTVEENVRAHRTISKIVLKGVQFVIRLGQKYLDEEN